MMRKFTREPGQRRYERLFVIACEGKETEPQYFAQLLRKQFEDIWTKEKIAVKVLPGNTKTNCTQVLDRLKKYLKEENVIEPYESWLVVDKDRESNTDERIKKVYQWQKMKKDKDGNTIMNHAIAISNPKFEYWLLLHFEDGKGIQSSAQCSERLKKYLPDYDKGICIGKFTKENIAEAVRRAKLRDSPQCADWPRTTGTTVYRLVEKLIQSKDS